MEKESFLNRLVKKWSLKNTTQALIILLVFALTGTSIAYLKVLIIGWLDIGDALPLYLRIIIAFFVILPIYNVVLLIYGFIFGQFKFFITYEKKFFKRIFGRKKKIKS